jgi:hypothetical protein
MQMMVNQLQRLGEMIAIRDNNFRVVSIHRNYHLLSVPNWIDFFSVNNDPDI